MEIIIKAPRGMNCGMKEWTAQYNYLGAGNTRLIRIISRSSIEVIVVWIVEENYYYISSPNFGIAIPGIPSLEETFWITEQLMNHEMSAPDAVTVAAVLKDMGDF